MKLQENILNEAWLLIKIPALEELKPAAICRRKTLAQRWILNIWNIWLYDLSPSFRCTLYIHALWVGIVYMKKNYFASNFPFIRNRWILFIGPTLFFCCCYITIVISKAKNVIFSSYQVVFLRLILKINTFKKTDPFPIFVWSAYNIHYFR